MGKTGHAMQTPRSGYAMQSPRTIAGGFMKVQRIDPVDGQRLTWEQLHQKYGGQYMNVQIAHYWYNGCKRVPQVASKANLRSMAPQLKAALKEEVQPLALQPDQDKVKAEHEAPAKAKAEQEAVAQAKVEQEAAAKAKVEQEAAAKAANSTVIQAKATEDEAAKTARAAAQAKKEAAAKVAEAKEAGKEVAANAAEKIATKAKSELVPQEDMQAPGPFCASFMVWLGDLTNKLCKRSFRGTEIKNKVAEEMPQRQLPEQLVGA